MDEDDPCMNGPASDPRVIGLTCHRMREKRRRRPSGRRLCPCRSRFVEKRNKVRQRSVHAPKFSSVTTRCAVRSVQLREPVPTATCWRASGGRRTARGRSRGGAASTSRCECPRGAPTPPPHVARCTLRRTRRDALHDARRGGNTPDR